MTKNFKKNTSCDSVNPKVAVDTAMNNAEDINWTLRGTRVIIKAEMMYPMVNPLFTKMDNM